MQCTQYLFNNSHFRYTVTRYSFNKSYVWEWNTIVVYACKTYTFSLMCEYQRENFQVFWTQIRRSLIFMHMDTIDQMFIQRSSIYTICSEDVNLFVINKQNLKNSLKKYAQRERERKITRTTTAKHTNKFSLSMLSLSDFKLIDL